MPLHSSMLIFLNSLDLILSWCRLSKMKLYHEWPSIRFSLLIAYPLHNLICFIMSSTFEIVSLSRHLHVIVVLPFIASTSTLAKEKRLKITHLVLHIWLDWSMHLNARGHGNSNFFSSTHIGLARFHRNIALECNID